MINWEIKDTLGIAFARIGEEQADSSETVVIDRIRVFFRNRKILGFKIEEISPEYAQIAQKSLSELAAMGCIYYEEYIIDTLSLNGCANIDINQKGNAISIEIIFNKADLYSVLNNQVGTSPMHLR